MATHAFYGELFAGRAAVFRHKSPALRSILCDVDDDVIAWHVKRAWPATDVFKLPAVEWLRAAAAELNEDWLLYLDPPFVHSTRTKRKIYRYEMDDAAHRMLLEQLADCPARVMISGYPSRLYAELLGEWHCDSRRVMTRGGLREECLWTNYNPAHVVADAGARAGINWRDRQRIARKVARQSRLFSALPDYEQDAILAGLLEERRRRTRRE